jgi:Ca-activated chloride channel family protein
VAIVPFAGSAVLSCPLTLDYGAARMLLDAAGPGSVPRPGTAIARAIRVGTRVFEGHEKKYKVMVLVTDGEDQEGDVEGAAREAAEQGIIIHTVGLGSPAGDLIPLENGFKRDRSGQMVMSRLDEATLREIADVTHGTYRRATAGGGELDAVYSQIENMEKREFSGQNYVRYQPRFQLPVALALLLLLGEMVISDRARRAPGKDEEVNRAA